MQDVRKTCAIEVASAVFSGKWKSVILYRLLNGPIRFNALQRSIPPINRRMLTLQLRELENDGIIHRKVYPQAPLKVEYSLTSLGKNLENVLGLLKEWGEIYIESKNKSD